MSLITVEFDQYCGPLIYICTLVTQRYMVHTLTICVIEANIARIKCLPVARHSWSDT